tara:strand:+ start:179 stop:430 length:252 start_codon:yes stop_codon:yes gene_type:complete
MPQYVYRCKACDSEFEVWHSMSERMTDCQKCHKTKVLFKIPCLSENAVHVERERKVGKLVDEHIRDAKEEVRKEKKKLKSVEL